MPVECLGPTKHQTRVVCKDRQRRLMKQTIWIPISPQIRQQHRHHRKITTWMPIPLHVMPPNSQIGQPTIHTQVHLGITVARPIRMTVSRPKLIKLLPYQKVLKVKSIGYYVLLVTHSCQQHSQSVLKIHFFSTSHEPWIRLLASDITAKSMVITPMIPSFAPFRNSCL